MSEATDENDLDLAIAVFREGMTDRRHQAFEKKLKTLLFNNSEYRVIRQRTFILFEQLRTMLSWPLVIVYKTG